MSSLKKQHLDNVFDTWNYLSEIKVGFFYEFELGTHADSDFESLLSHAKTRIISMSFFDKTVQSKMIKKMRMMLQSL